METALKNVKSHLAARIPTVKAALEAELAVTIPLYATMELFDVLAPSYPSIEILPVTTDIQIAHPAGPLEDGWQLHHITLRISHTGGTPSDVSLVLLRYREIIKRIVRADPSFGGLCELVRLGRSDWAPMMKAQESLEFAQELYQELTVRAYY